MKVALFTIWHDKNFGAELQAYATIQTLQEMGHTVQLVDYRLNDQPFLLSRQGLSTAFEKISPQNRMFERFWARMPRSRRYLNLDQLVADPPLADYYLVGSDQVWNPKITGGKIKTFFLPFGSSEVKKASYASSLGGGEWLGDDELTTFAKQQLQQFKIVSCREESAVRELERILGVKATAVLDPTLLRRNYDELTGTIKENNSLVYYSLYNEPKITAVAGELAKRMGTDCLSANKRTALLGKIPWTRTSIEDWIHYIAGARFVLTHSFHGLVLALLYHRPFMVLYTSSNNRQGRITGLLQKIGLIDRFFINEKDALESGVWEKPIDYEMVDSKIDALRNSSLEFLKSVFE